VGFFIVFFLSQSKNTIPIYSPVPLLQETSPDDIAIKPIKVKTKNNTFFILMLSLTSVPFSQIKILEAV